MGSFIPARGRLPQAMAHGVFRPACEGRALIKTRGNAALNANMTREITRGRRHRVPRPLPWNLKTLKWLRFASASGITASEPIPSRYFCVILTLLREAAAGYRG